MGRGGEGQIVNIADDNKGFIADHVYCLFLDGLALSVDLYYLKMKDLYSVSYTHLTLPTIYSV